MSVTIQVPIPDELLPLLEWKARNAGVERDEYIRNLVSRDLKGPRPLDEILAEFRTDVAQSGMADTELAELFEQARRDASPAR